MVSQFPLLSSRDFWGPVDFARRLLDDDFGRSFLDGELFDPPFLHQRYYICPRGRSSQQQQQVQAANEVVKAPNKFTVKLDIRHFNPEEISVKTVDNSIVIHGKHEEKADEHGFIQREFTRRYVLPDDVDPEAVTSSLSAKGVLSIEAPRKGARSERVVPVAVEHVKKDENPEEKAALKA